MRWATVAEGQRVSLGAGLLAGWARGVRRALGLTLLCAPALGWAQGAWFAGERPAPVAHEAVALLVAADSHGLRPADYGAAAMQAAVQVAVQGPPLGPAQAARLSAALEAALLRYLRHLNAGRVAPSQVHQRFPLPEPSLFDAEAVLRDALAAGRLALAVQAAAPALPLYALLREQLSHYRALAAEPVWALRLPPLPAPAPRGTPTRLQPGQAWAGVEALAQRLRLWGDLPAAEAASWLPAPAVAGAASSPQVVPMYETPLVQAVQAFQRRHGLADDGVIGRATWLALQVGPAQRVRQIELTLERLRWTPLLQGSRMVVINVPEFVLRAYEVRDGQVQVRLAMRVIVGRSGSSRTPLFSELMRRVEFSPYWNVPASIARQELVPQLRRNPEVFTAQGYEFVTGSGRVHTTLSPTLLEAVLAGQARIRQRPGPKNALGDVKFVFPNHDAIYLHHTPSVDLFARDRRDFSHGCIRVQDPVALAGFVLARQPGWDEARIRAAMGAGAMSQQALDEPLPVLIAYGTALVVQGRPHFFNDVYGYDEVLDSALRQLRLPALPSPV